MIKLCIITTHPIQYMAPWFRQLSDSDNVDLYVIFLREPTATEQGIGFGKSFTWDVPLREGYRSTVLEVGSKLLNVPATIKKVKAKLGVLDPHAVLLTGWNEPSLAFCYPLLKLMGIPVLVRGESNDLRGRSVRAKFLHRLLLTCVDAVVQNGAANRRFYLNNNVPEKKIFPGAYFVDSDRMIAMAETHSHQRDAQRAQHGFEPNDFVFAFSGKHVAFKRPLLLVEAAAICNAHKRPAKLLFAGSGELTSVVQERALALGVDARFTDFLNQSVMWKAYLPADAFVLPSDNGETWGLVTNEAMLFGLPVIVSRSVGCAEDLVIEDETGYTFSGGAAELAEAMMRLSANREHAAKMGSNGRARVQAFYSMPVATSGLLKALNSVVPTITRFSGPDLLQAMRQRTIFIVGNRGGTNVAASFMRSAEIMGLKPTLFDATLAQSPFRLVNAFHWRLRGKRAPYMVSFGTQLAVAIARSKPRYLLTTGLSPVAADVVHWARQQGVLCLHYSTDDPWNPAQRAAWFLQALPAYHVIFSARQSNMADFETLGCPNVHHLPFAYDESIFNSDSPTVAAEDGKVLFVGGADRDRADFIRHLVAANIPLQLVGGYWRRYRALRPFALGHKAPQELIALTRSAPINLCLVRRANRDGHVMRSFEIAALGGCMVAEDTAEHRVIFGPEGACVLYFDGPQEAISKIRILLADTALRERLGAAARQKILASGNTYTHRLQTMLHVTQELKPENEHATL